MNLRLLGAVLYLLTLNANATVIYTYTGQNFNSFTGSTFDASMRVTGYIELAVLLDPNLVDENVTPLSYSFTDGVSTIAKDDNVSGADTFRFYTNTDGAIFMWNVGLLNSTPNPAQLGDTQSEIRTRHEQTFFASQTLDFGQLATCIKLQSGDECAENSVDLGEVYNQPGVWAVVPIPPAIDIEKRTNGNQADDPNDPDVPRIAQGETVTWTYQVTNTGEVEVSEAELVVTDSQPGVTPTLDTGSDDDDLILSPGETWIYRASAEAKNLATSTSGLTIVDGCDPGSTGNTRPTYENIGTVVGTAMADSVTDSDPSHYCNPSNQDPSVYVDHASVTANEGQTASNSGTVIDPDNDTVTLSASVGTVTNNNDGTWSWSWDTTDGPADSQTVTISADDGNGGIATVDFDLTVNNVAPTVDSITLPADPVAIDAQPVTVSAEFSDPAGTLDQHSCTIDYGDGTGAQPATVTETTCSGNYTYSEPGVYPVTVTVTDKDGGVGSRVATTYIVIYDASGGFVTGGGWIESPASACPDFCGGAAGHASFGLVSGYKRGASVPTGNTQFSFSAGGLNFHSDSYQWLVVNQGGENAQFKGVGTINGQLDSNGQPYGFMVWAGDSDPDTFRIRIWSELDGMETDVYDNGFNQPIGGGSIVIHTGKGGNK